jgi:hypothetical protein
MWTQGLKRKEGMSADGAVVPDAVDTGKVGPISKLTEWNVRPSRSRVRWSGASSEMTALGKALGVSAPVCQRR